MLIAVLDAGNTELSEIDKVFYWGLEGGTDAYQINKCILNFKVKKVL